MCLQLLVLRHRHHSITYVTNTFFREMLEGDLAVVTVEVHAIVSQCIAMGWQGMIGTAGIISGTLTCIVAQEYAARIHHFLCKLLIISSCYDEMLRGIGIAEIDGFLLVLHKDELGVVQ